MKLKFIIYPEVFNIFFPKARVNKSFTVVNMTVKFEVK